MDIDDLSSGGGRRRQIRPCAVLTTVLMVRVVLRRWIVWVAERGAADVAGVCGTLGGTLGALAGWISADSSDLWSHAAAAGGAGAAISGGVGLAIWGFCRSAAVQPKLPRVADRGDLFEEFRVSSRAQVRRQWRVMTEGRDRLNSSFTAYRRIAPPRSFTGSLRHRSDLAAALDAAAVADGGPRLLIVGLPGYGKTVALLEIAQHLIDDHGDEFGLPVVLSLGSWTEDDYDLAAWMVGELCAVTGPLPGADRAVTRWIAAGRVAPVLDGLDEIADPANRERCVEAINTFIDHAPNRTAVVVASRPDEYTEATDDGANRLAVNAAIELGRLSQRRVAAWLRELDTEVSVFLADLVENHEEQPPADVLRVPLWLWIAGKLDRKDADRFAAAADHEDAQRILTDAYLTHSIAALDEKVPHDARACRRMLAAIAGFLSHPASPDSTTFRLENLTPPHPEPALVRAVIPSFGIGNGLFYGFVIGLLLGVDVGVIFGLVVAVTVVIARYRNPRTSYADSRPTRTRFDWPGAPQLLAMVTVWPVLAVVRGLSGWQAIRSFASALLQWLIVGSASGVIYALLDTPATGLTVGIAAGLMGLVHAQSSYLAASIADRLVRSHAIQGHRLDEGHSASRTSLQILLIIYGLGGSLYGGVTGSLVGKTVYGLLGGLVFGMPYGLAASRDKGGWYLVLQRRVRRQAQHMDLLPEKPTPFLSSAADVAILRRAGGGVQFRHRLLAKRLAEEAPTPGLMDLRLAAGGDQAPEPFQEADATADVDVPIARAR